VVIRRNTFISDFNRKIEIKLECKLLTTGGNSKAFKRESGIKKKVPLFFSVGFKTSICPSNFLRSIVVFHQCCCAKEWGISLSKHEEINPRQ
jgi:hypothetical protein